MTEMAKTKIAREVISTTVQVQLSRQDFAGAGAGAGTDAVAGVAFALACVARYHSNVRRRPSSNPTTGS